jgi:hypothetical protein
VGYRLLFDNSAAPLEAERSSGLPPDWFGIDKTTGVVVALPPSGGATTHYGYDAPRTYWRLALDLRWNGDGRATAYLGQAGFLRDEVNRSGSVRAVYAHDGTVVQDRPTIVGVAGAVAALLTLDPSAANTLYASQLIGDSQRRTNGEVYWGDAADLYAQEWGWFATALYANQLPDMWHAHQTS